MAVIKYKGPDKTVNTINDRNNIPGDKRVDRMKVVVLDAIADINAGRGWALYMWLKDSSKWILISKEFADLINFSTEEKTIVNGVVVADYVPMNNVVWDCYVTLSDGSVLDIDPYVDGVNITMPSDIDYQLDDLKLHYSYVFGTTVAQLSAIAFSKSEMDEHYLALRNELFGKIQTFEDSLI